MRVLQVVTVEKVGSSKKKKEKKKELSSAGEDSTASLYVDIL
jgi:hypothetical protein